MKKALVIGGGLAGCVSARILAEKGYKVKIVDRDSDLGGMAKDFAGVCEWKGYKQFYGPHIFHTSDPKVLEFAKKYMDIIPFRHTVRSDTDAGLLHFPICLNTLEDAGLDESYLEDVKRSWSSNPEKAELSMANMMKSKIGNRLYELLIKNYTFRQWRKKPEHLSSDLARRVTVKMERDVEFFDHEKLVGLPNGGFTYFMWNLVDHKNIEVDLLENITVEDIASMLQYDEIVMTGRLDDFFRKDHLKFVKVEFRLKEEDTEELHPQAYVINNGKKQGEVSRISYYHKFGEVLGLNDPVKVVGYEIPNSDKKSSNVIACYPYTVEKSTYNYYKRHNERLQKLFSLLFWDKKVHFLGRLATYQYLDMDKVILQVLNSFEKGVE